ncbi:hypothetical protein [Nocardioides immobilis]|uniref:hypothetical protein n=1 Tax=Nocardioides immobilis TaxID=2049295 RepID=UPI0015FB45C8|nr:hypothetical protein [Nocardioides immobilis]
MAATAAPGLDLVALGAWTHLDLKKTKGDQVALGAAGAHRAALADLVVLAGEVGHAVDG